MMVPFELIHQTWWHFQNRQFLHQAREHNLLIRLQRYFLVTDSVPIAVKAATPKKTKKIVVMSQIYLRQGTMCQNLGEKKRKIDTFFFEVLACIQTSSGADRDREGQTGGEGYDCKEYPISDTRGVHVHFWENYFLRHGSLYIQGKGLSVIITLYN